MAVMKSGNQLCEIFKNGIQFMMPNNWQVPEGEGLGTYRLMLNVNRCCHRVVVNTHSITTVLFGVVHGNIGVLQ